MTPIEIQLKEINDANQEINIRLLSLLDQAQQVLKFRMDVEREHEGFFRQHPDISSCPEDWLIVAYQAESEKYILSVIELCETVRRERGKIYGIHSEPV